MKRLTPGLFVLGLALLAGQSGCAVPQAPGNGEPMRRVEPQTRTGYWLYLPEDYVAHNGARPDRQRWPLVVTFHGMKPWDDSGPQIREWQQEADRYGFIVVAPDLHTSDSFMQYPLHDPDLPYVRRDEKVTLAIMNEVFRTTNADPSRVLATSWSCGGYLAHFMVNRHPERFSCLAVRQSNFNADLLNPGQISKYRNMRVGIFFGQNDFKACRDESIEAVEWYRQNRFDVAAKYVSGLGHERTPQTAAAFFADTIGVTPKTPPDLAKMVLKDIPPEELGKYSNLARSHKVPERDSTAPIAASTGPRHPPVDSLFSEGSPIPPTVRRPTRVPPSEPVRRAPPPTRTPPDMSQTRKRSTIQPYEESDTSGSSKAPDISNAPKSGDVTPNVGRSLW